MPFFPFQESRALVKVTVEKRSGGLPVHGARVEWELFDPSGNILLDSGAETTPRNGEITLQFAADPILEGSVLRNDDHLPLKLSVTKSTGQIAHSFLCGDEEWQCSGGSQVVYLKHLDFDRRIDFR